MYKLRGHISMTRLESWIFDSSKHFQAASYYGAVITRASCPHRVPVDRDTDQKINKPQTNHISWVTY